jgi:opacity protein-like surface antigen
MGYASYLINRLHLKLFPTILVFFLSLITVFDFPCLLYADNSKSIQESESRNNGLPVFARDRLSLQLVWGKLYSPFLQGTYSTDFDYSRANLRAGWMIDDPAERQFFFPGNFEAVLEITYSDVTKGSGNYLAGAGAMIRYNVVYPDRIVRPFIQVGGGIVLTDVYKDRSQELIGQSYQFDLQLGAGIRFPVARNWSIDVEGIYNHISNGGLSERNDGVNAGGVLIGVTYFFDRLRQ